MQLIDINRLEAQIPRADLHPRIVERRDEVVEGTLGLDWFPSAIFKDIGV